MYFWKWSEWLYEVNPNALLFSEKRILYKEAMFFEEAVSVGTFLEQYFWNLLKNENEFWF